MFIAGDAAHSHPPYGGFGLNNGLEDAANLGWKLAAELQGWGGETLLHSYSDERRPIFRETAEDFIAARIEERWRVSRRYTRARPRRVRERVGQARGHGGDRVHDLRAELRGLGVVVGPPGGVCSAHGKHVFTARAGHHLAPQQLSSGRNVFEELGRLHAARVRRSGRGGAGVRGGRAKRRVPLKVIRDSYADGRTAYEAQLTLGASRPIRRVVRGSRAWRSGTAHGEGRGAGVITVRPGLFYLSPLAGRGRREAPGEGPINKSERVESSPSPDSSLRSKSTSPRKRGEVKKRTTVRLRQVLQSSAS